MQIRVPFAYEAEVRDGRRRRKVILGEWATVEVNDVASEDAPVFAEFEVTDGQQTIVSEVREFGGHCYRPKVEVPHGRPYDIFAGQVTADTLGQANPIVKTFFGHGWGDVVGRGNDAIEPDSLDVVLDAANNGTRGLEVVSSFRRAVLQRNHDVAATLIVIDGQVWEQCLAPHLRLALSKRPPEVKLSFDRPDYSRALEDDIIVPISEMPALEEAVRKFYEIDEQRELTNADGRQYIEGVWRPEDVVYPAVTSIGAAPLDAETPYLIGRAQHYLKAHFGHIIGDLQDRTSAFIQSWLAVKDAADNAKVDPSAESVERLVATLEDYRDRSELEPPRMDDRCDRPFFGTERHKARFDLRLACELSGWKAFLQRMANDHTIETPRTDHRPR